ncbi:polysaccharide deacetylase family protein [Corynebacterium timonense]|uniref:polysaccharide deacetylase family protein n=1 Tax=Corynebacterium timonense TaxID=441500 RepID=UPI001E3B5B68|nr:polysaccharide deacetylase family protein [Corynebacterium timonense]
MLPLIGAAGSAASCAAPDAGPTSRTQEAPPATTTATTTTAAPETPQPADVAARYRDAVPSAWGVDLPGIVASLAPGTTSIALTFDACGGPHGSLIDDPLLALLEEQAVPATLFWNKRWIDANPQRAQQIAQNPLFQIENHGTAHKPLSVNGRAAYGIPGTATPDELVEEIEGNRRFLREFLGVESNWFRSGTAFYDDVAVEIARDLGVSLAGFAVNGDAGATLPGPAVASALRHSSAGAIVLMHMNQPGRGTADGVREAIPQLRAAGFTFVALGEAPVGRRASTMPHVH